MTAAAGEVTGSGTIIVIGAGGHAKVVIEALRAMGRTVAGVVAPMTKDTTLLGAPVLGDDDVLPRLRAGGITEAALGIGDNRVREKLAVHLLDLGFSLPVIRHPTAWISPSSVLGAGAVVLQHAALSADTRYGRAALINSGAIVEHDSVIGDAAHVAPRCALAGHVRIGERTLVGIGTAVRPDIAIGSDCVIGAGSVVVFDVPAGLTVMGCPARPRGMTPERAG